MNLVVHDDGNVAVEKGTVRLPFSMQLSSHSTIVPHRFAEIAEWVKPQTTTERVVNAVISAGNTLHDAHQMDEYTIDLVVELHDGLVLVYDTT